MILFYIAIVKENLYFINFVSRKEFDYSNYKNYY